MQRLCIIVILIVSLFANNGCAFFTPQIDSLENLNLVAATQVFDSNGKLISKLFEENRIVVSINNISPYLQQAIVANEDSRFFNHIGIDPIGIVRAVWVNLRSGGLVEGGSTLTQQLAKNMFLTQERTFTRKIKEAFWAIIIERKFSKQEILQAYLNQVYFGEGAYGVEAASQVYFGKHASELTLGESALLAGLPRGPNLYSPYIDNQAALERRKTVLAGMVKEGYVTQKQAEEAQRQSIVLIGKKKRVVQASYFLDYVANELVGRYGANRVYKGGLKVYTTLDSVVQQGAEAVLGQYQGGVLALDPRTGYIKAMVGGRSYEESQLNRTMVEVRQPGSAFKPFVYAVALSQGLTANSVIIDQPININGYAPQNYDKKFHGPITLKKAIRLSVNVASVKLGQQVGIDKVLDLAKNMGITTLVPQDNNLATALGGLTQGVNLFEMATAYTAFANGGIVSRPISILKVLDENDQLLEEAHITQQSVLSSEVAYILTNMLQSVIEDGTGTPANIGRMAAGKTGTTDNYETAWFMGYTPELLVGIYVGNDNRTPVGISGTQVAGLWGKMMTQVVSGTKPTTFTIPPNVVTNIPICTDSGKRATPGCLEIEYSAFVKGTEPIVIDTQIRPKNQPKEKAEPSDNEKEKTPWWKLPLPRLPSM
ncbi:PBP1A family penicillin-binding protein [Pelosinus sp. IPA-1]|uniref:transglycosylase domain-containing protein n=1 Tax=Pelosinus sp. IPA-1 TaxID=3029569 RepID=UPI00243616F3|nr:PBP1A family penicillin-binding protein [Pelosinus sp. IPA-1]GMA99620.1 penicillin-binding protein [Pelosinus sp. IPA-1]